MYFINLIIVFGGRRGCLIIAYLILGLTCRSEIWDEVLGLLIVVFR